MLVMAYKKGKIENVKSIIDKMREKNFWIDDKLYQKILKEIK